MNSLAKFESFHSDDVFDDEISGETAGPAGFIGDVLGENNGSFYNELK